MGGFHFCGGTIVSSSYVLTAAHCVAETKDGIKIVAGVTDLTKLNKPHNVYEIIIHPQYEAFKIGPMWVNDIALLRVAPFSYSKTVSKVTLPERGSEIHENAIGTVSGWGRLTNGRFSKLLQRVNIMVTSQQYCEKIYSEAAMTVYPTQYCAHNPDENSGPCTGDEGGPMTIDGVMEGIISNIFNCGSVTYPNIHTRVADYVDWIYSHIG
ncbi:trypsin-like [Venturia canescens]|uniref:trypsin-like n=1 Tax=Venturia canescens TaxID=32260 RepID=UPI001C9BFEF0|nr:trypsin-like [Venturia canescens]